MNLLGDQIARLMESLPEGSKVRVLICLDREGWADMGDGARTRPTTESTRESRRIPPPSRASMILWLLGEISQRPTLNFSNDLLDSAEVSRRMVQRGRAPVRGRGMHALLQAAGFVKLGLIRGPDGPANYWSVYPEKFTDEKGKAISARVRDHLTPL